MKNKAKLLIGLGLLLLFFIVWLHNVPKTISQKDKESLSTLFTSELVSAKELSFDEQIEFIDNLVKTLHGDLIVGMPIQYNTHREPAELIENGGGLCYDFSRTIEKQLIANGFTTRHVAVYVKQGNFWTTIASVGVYSHSLSEVKTKNGWMIIDSNLPFYAQDTQGKVYSFEDLEQLGTSPTWKLDLHQELRHFYNGDTVYVYGLYSRHGRFYPPYNFIPDYNFRELFYNL